MTAVALFQTRSFLASAVIQALRTQTPSSWKPMTYYPLGSQVESGGKIYTNINAGTSVLTPPTHGSGIFSVDGVQWLYLGLSVGTTDIASNLYIAIGKPTEWNDGDTPIAAQSNPAQEIQALSDVEVLVRLTNTNTRIGLRKVAWQTGTVYSMFDPSVSSALYGSTLHSLYVMVGVNIYKCLDNNGGVPSTDQPTGTQLGPVLMSDGYIWKFMGTISTLDATDFGTTLFSPVVQKYTNDGSDQWDVQQAAKDGSISAFTSFVLAGDNFGATPTVNVVGSGTGAGAGVVANESSVDQFDLIRVYSTGGGQGYNADTFAVVQETGAIGSGASVDLVLENGEVSGFDNLVGGSSYTNAVVVIVGDGTGAKASLTLASGVVVDVNITSGGSGYTWARAFIIPGKAGAVSVAIMAPAGGHGRNLIAELNANTLLVSCSIDETLKPYVIDGLGFRQVLLVSSVKPAAGSRPNAEAYLGKAHPNYEANPDELNQAAIGGGHLLFVNNTEATVYSSETEELLKVAITL